MRDKMIFIWKGAVCLFLFAGAGMLCYPTAANMWNQRRNDETIASYDDGMNETEASDFFEEAETFNEKLLTLQDQWTLSEEMERDYFKTLDVSGDGMIGSVKIPKIGANLPIYHGSADAVLSTAIGHMEGSSFPIGGIGTHAVLLGHAGMVSADLFTRLDEMEIGDFFFICVLGKQFAYRVMKINVSLPDETGYLRIDPNLDQVTLLTCTPPGINSHRLLVTGVRVLANGMEVEEIHNQKQNAIGSVFGICMMAVGIFSFIKWRKKDG